jgi:hypothetical protein
MKQWSAYLGWYGLGGGLLIVALLPVIAPGWLAAHPFPTSSGALLAAKGCLLLLPIVAAGLAFRTQRYGRPERRWAAVLSLVAAGFAEVTHFWMVDRGHYFSPTQFADNTAWQEAMHTGILALSPNYLPHSYRFLPDSIVELFKWMCGDFVFARVTYRLLFNTLLFATIYRYARLFVAPVSASASVLAILLLYPIGLMSYAGQLVDPFSHLSFIVCLYCLGAGYEAAFGPSLLIGIFAKESVILMALCRVFYGTKRFGAVAASLAYLAAGLFVAVQIRKHVMHGRLQYGNISGVDMSQIFQNFAWWRVWVPLYLCTVGVLLPGACLGWKVMEIRFRATGVMLLAGLIVSSALFSWLAEVRNLLPAFVPMVIAGMTYVERRFTFPAGSPAAAPSALA